MIHLDYWKSQPFLQEKKGRVSTLSASGLCLNFDVEIMNLGLSGLVT